MKGAKAKGAASKVSKEALKAVKDRKVGKRKAATKADKGGKKQVKKVSVAKKDPNKPKRPPSAFFIFLKEFRETFKKENPNVKATVSAVAKAGGAEWKSMSSAEKAFYEAKAAKRKTEYAAKKKAEYEKLMNAYNKKQVDTSCEYADIAESMADDGDEESDRSNSEVNNDDEDSEQEEDDDEDDED
ncbi:hypothetical protein U1Q18_008544 [Sarracenia purpurea var. burkii]